MPGSTRCWGFSPSPNPASASAWVFFPDAACSVPLQTNGQGRGDVVGDGSLLPDEIQKRLTLSAMAGNWPNTISSEAKRVGDIN